MEAQALSAGFSRPHGGRRAQAFCVKTLKSKAQSPLRAAFAAVPSDGSGELWRTMTSKPTLTAAAVFSFLAIAPAAGLAADLGADCCADLDERVAELEATSTRKGNRAVSLTISGEVNRALLIWDDGADSDAYVV